MENINLINYIDNKDILNDNYFIKDINNNFLNIIKKNMLKSNSDSNFYITYSNSFNSSSKLTKQNIDKNSINNNNNNNTKEDDNNNLSNMFKNTLLNELNNKNNLKSLSYIYDANFLLFEDNNNNNNKLSIVQTIDNVFPSIKSRKHNYDELDSDLKASDEAAKINENIIKENLILNNLNYNTLKSNFSSYSYNLFNSFKDKSLNLLTNLERGLIISYLFNSKFSLVKQDIYNNKNIDNYNDNNALMVTYNKYDNKSYSLTNIISILSNILTTSYFISNNNNICDNSNNALNIIENLFDNLIVEIEVNTINSQNYNYKVYNNIEFQLINIFNILKNNKDYVDFITAYYLKILTFFKSQLIFELILNELNNFIDKCLNYSIMFKYLEKLEINYNSLASLLFGLKVNSNNNSKILINDNILIKSQNEFENNKYNLFNENIVYNLNYSNEEYMKMLFDSNNTINIANKDTNNNHKNYHYLSTISFYAEYMFVLIKTNLIKFRYLEENNNNNNNNNNTEFKYLLSVDVDQYASCYKINICKDNLFIIGCDENDYFILIYDFNLKKLNTINCSLIYDNNISYSVNFLLVYDNQLYCFFTKNVETCMSIANINYNTNSLFINEICISNISINNLNNNKTILNNNFKLLKQINNVDYTYIVKYFSIYIIDSKSNNIAFKFDLIGNIYSNIEYYESINLYSVCNNNNDLTIKYSLPEIYNSKLYTILFEDNNNKINIYAQYRYLNNDSSIYPSNIKNNYNFLNNNNKILIDYKSIKINYLNYFVINNNNTIESIYCLKNFLLINYLTGSYLYSNYSDNNESLLFNNIYIDFNSILKTGINKSIHKYLIKINTIISMLLSFNKENINSHYNYIMSLLIEFKYYVVNILKLIYNYVYFNNTSLLIKSIKDLNLLDKIFLIDKSIDTIFQNFSKEIHISQDYIYNIKINLLYIKLYCIEYFNLNNLLNAKESYLIEIADIMVISNYSSDLFVNSIKSFICALMTNLSVLINDYIHSTKIINDNLSLIEFFNIIIKSKELAMYMLELALTHLSNNNYNNNSNIFNAIYSIIELLLFCISNLYSLNIEDVIMLIINETIDSFIIYEDNDNNNNNNNNSNNNNTTLNNKYIVYLVKRNIGFLILYNIYSKITSNNSSINNYNQKLFKLSIILIEKIYKNISQYINYSDIYYKNYFIDPLSNNQLVHNYDNNILENKVKLTKHMVEEYSYSNYINDYYDDNKKNDSTALKNILNNIDKDNNNNNSSSLTLNAKKIVKKSYKFNEPTNLLIKINSILLSYNSFNKQFLINYKTKDISNNFKSIKGSLLKNGIININDIVELNIEFDLNINNKELSNTNNKNLNINILNNIINFEIIYSVYKYNNILINNSKETSYNNNRTIIVSNFYQDLLISRMFNSNLSSIDFNKDNSLSSKVLNIVIYNIFKSIRIGNILEIEKLENNEVELVIKDKNFSKNKLNDYIKDIEDGKEFYNKIFSTKLFKNIDFPVYDNLLNYDNNKKNYDFIVNVVNNNYNNSKNNNNNNNNKEYIELFNNLKEISSDYLEENKLIHNKLEYNEKVIRILQDNLPRHLSYLANYGIDDENINKMIFEIFSLVVISLNLEDKYYSIKSIVNSYDISKKSTDKFKINNINSYNNNNDNNLNLAFSKSNNKDFKDKRFTILYNIWTEVSKIKTWLGEVKSNLLSDAYSIHEDIKNKSVFEEKEELISVDEIYQNNLNNLIKDIRDKTSFINSIISNRIDIIVDNADYNYLELISDIFLILKSPLFNISTFKERVLYNNNIVNLLNNKFKLINYLGYYLYNLSLNCNKINNNNSNDYINNLYIEPFLLYLNLISQDLRTGKEKMPYYIYNFITGADYHLLKRASLNYRFLFSLINVTITNRLSNTNYLVCNNNNSITNYSYNNTYKIYSQRTILLNALVWRLTDEDFELYSKIIHSLHNTMKLDEEKIEKFILSKFVLLDNNDNNNDNNNNRQNIIINYNKTCKYIKDFIIKDNHDIQYFKNYRYEYIRFLLILASQCFKKLSESNSNISNNNYNNNTHNSDEFELDINNSNKFLKEVLMILFELSELKIENLINNYNIDNDYNMSEELKKKDIVYSLNSLLISNDQHIVFILFKLIQYKEERLKFILKLKPNMPFILLIILSNTLKSIRNNNISKNKTIKCVKILNILDFIIICCKKDLNIKSLIIKSFEFTFKNNKIEFTNKILNYIFNYSSKEVNILSIHKVFNKYYENNDYNNSTKTVSLVELLLIISMYELTNIDTSINNLQNNFLIKNKYIYIFKAFSSFILNIFKEFPVISSYYINKITTNVIYSNLFVNNKLNNQYSNPLILSCYKEKLAILLMKLINDYTEDCLFFPGNKVKFIDQSTLKNISSEEYLNIKNAEINVFNFFKDYKSISNKFDTATIVYNEKYSFNDLNEDLNINNENYFNSQVYVVLDKEINEYNKSNNPFDYNIKKACIKNLILIDDYNSKNLIRLISFFNESCIIDYIVKNSCKNLFVDLNDNDLNSKYASVIKQDITNENLNKDFYDLKHNHFIEINNINILKNNTLLLIFLNNVLKNCSHSESLAMSFINNISKDSLNIINELIVFYLNNKMFYLDNSTCLSICEYSKLFFNEFYYNCFNEVKYNFAYFINNCDFIIKEVDKCRYKNCMFLSSKILIKSLLINKNTFINNNLIHDIRIDNSKKELQMNFNDNILNFNIVDLINVDSCFVINENYKSNKSLGFVMISDLIKVLEVYININDDIADNNNNALNKEDLSNIKKCCSCNSELYKYILESFFNKKCYIIVNDNHKINNNIIYIDKTKSFDMNNLKLLFSKNLLIYCVLSKNNLINNNNSLNNLGIPIITYSNSIINNKEKELSSNKSIEALDNEHYNLIYILSNPIYYNKHNILYSNSIFKLTKKQSISLDNNNNNNMLGNMFDTNNSNIKNDLSLDDSFDSVKNNNIDFYSFIENNLFNINISNASKLYLQLLYISLSYDSKTNNALSNNMNVLSNNVNNNTITKEELLFIIRSIILELKLCNRVIILNNNENLKEDILNLNKTKSNIIENISESNIVNTYFNNNNEFDYIVYLIQKCFDKLLMCSSNNYLKSIFMSCLLDTMTYYSSDGLSYKYVSDVLDSTNTTNKVLKLNKENSNIIPYKPVCNAVLNTRSKRTKNKKSIFVNIQTSPIDSYKKVFISNELMFSKLEYNINISKSEAINDNIVFLKTILIFVNTVLKENDILKKNMSLVNYFSNISNNNNNNNNEIYKDNRYNNNTENNLSLTNKNISSVNIDLITDNILNINNCNKFELSNKKNNKYNIKDYLILINKFISLVDIFYYSKTIDNKNLVVCTLMIIKNITNYIIDEVENMSTFEEFYYNFDLSFFTSFRKLINVLKNSYNTWLNKKLNIFNKNNILLSKVFYDLVELYYKLLSIVLNDDNSINEILEVITSDLAVFETTILNNDYINQMSINKFLEITSEFKIYFYYLLIKKESYFKDIFDKCTKLINKNNNNNNSNNNNYLFSNKTIEFSISTPILISKKSFNNKVLKIDLYEELNYLLINNNINIPKYTSKLLSLNINLFKNNHLLINNNEFILVFIDKSLTELYDYYDFETLHSINKDSTGININYLYNANKTISLNSNNINCLYIVKTNSFNLNEIFSFGSNKNHALCADVEENKTFFNLNLILSENDIVSNNKKYKHTKSFKFGYHHTFQLFYSGSILVGGTDLASSIHEDKVKTSKLTADNYLNSELNCKKTNMNNCNKVENQVGIKNIWVSNFNSTVALTYSEELYVVGVNSDSKFGKDIQDTNKPLHLKKPLSKCSKVKTIALGYLNLMVVLTDGTAYSMGNNSYYQTGNINTTDNISSWYKLKLDSSKYFIENACGGEEYFLLLIKNLDKNYKYYNRLQLYSIGSNENGRAGVGDDKSCRLQMCYGTEDLEFTLINTRNYSSSAITKDGKLYTWGCNFNGSLGLPEYDKKDVYVPTMVTDFQIDVYNDDSQYNNFSDINVFVESISISLFHSIILARVSYKQSNTNKYINSKRVFTCGNNDFGACGEYNDGSDNIVKYSSKFLEIKSIRKNYVPVRIYSSKYQSYVLVIDCKELRNIVYGYDNDINYFKNYEYNELDHNRISKDNVRSDIKSYCFNCYYSEKYCKDEEENKDTDKNYSILNKLKNYKELSAKNKKTEYFNNNNISCNVEQYNIPSTYICLYNDRITNKNRLRDIANNYNTFNKVVLNNCFTLTNSKIENNKSKICAYNKKHNLLNSSINKYYESDINIKHFNDVYITCEECHYENADNCMKINNNIISNISIAINKYYNILNNQKSQLNCLLKLLIHNSSNYKDNNNLNISAYNKDIDKNCINSNSSNNNKNEITLELNKSYNYKCMNCLNDIISLKYLSFNCIKLLYENKNKYNFNDYCNKFVCFSCFKDFNTYDLHRKSNNNTYNKSFCTSDIYICISKVVSKLVICKSSFDIINKVNNELLDQNTYIKIKKHINNNKINTNYTTNNLSLEINSYMKIDVTDIYKSREYKYIINIITSNIRNVYNECDSFIETFINLIKLYILDCRDIILDFSDIKNDIYRYFVLLFIYNYVYETYNNNITSESNTDSIVNNENILTNNLISNNNKDNITGAKMTNIDNKNKCINLNNKLGQDIDTFINNQFNININEILNIIEHVHNKILKDATFKSKYPKLTTFYCKNNINLSNYNHIIKEYENINQLSSTYNNNSNNNNNNNNNYLKNIVKTIFYDIITNYPVNNLDLQIIFTSVSIIDSKIISIVNSLTNKALINQEEIYSINNKYMLDVIYPSISNVFKFLNKDKLLNLFKKLIKESSVFVDFEETTFTINRLKALKIYEEEQLDTNRSKSLLCQLFNKMIDYDKRKYRCIKDNRLFQVSFAGEGSSDYGGPYRDLMHMICEELQSSIYLDYLVKTPNGKSESGIEREKLILNEKLFFNNNSNSNLDNNYINKNNKLNLTSNNNLVSLLNAKEDIELKIKIDKDKNILQFIGKLLASSVYSGLNFNINMHYYIWYLLTSNQFDSKDSFELNENEIINYLEEINIDNNNKINSKKLKLIEVSKITNLSMQEIDEINLRFSFYEYIDIYFYNLIKSYSEISNIEDFEILCDDLNFTVYLSTGEEHELISNGKNFTVKYESLPLYVLLCKRKRVLEFECSLKELKKGFE